MTWFEAIIIAIVEGLTEFLPVSSTAHMILTEKILGLDTKDDFVMAFTVCIQLGAILSVVVLYYKKFFQSLDFYFKLVVGVLPAVLAALAFNVKKLLGNDDVILIIAISLLIGGVVMLFIDKWFNKPKENQTITYKNAFIIGLFQCIAMIPGVSRSMATIVGGMSRGYTRANAAEFSFFLAVPTMFGATVKELYDFLKVEGNTNVLSEQWPLLLLGNVVAFIVAMLAIKFFISYISKYGFKGFGWYRIVLGTALLILIICGVELSATN